MQDLGDNRPQPPIRDRGQRQLKKNMKRLERLAVTYMDVGDLKPNSYNPNRQGENDFELLCRSIKEDGFTQPIVALKSSHVIVDGEHRWRAAKHLKYLTVPVVLVDMTPEQMRIATLRHNRARGSEDLELSVEVLRDLQELGAMEWAQESLQMTTEELNELLSDVPIVDQFAGESFSESWIPIKAIDKQENVSVEGKQLGDLIVSSSQKTVDMFNKTKEIAEKIEDIEEKRKLYMELEKRSFRIAMSFSGKEAKLVSKILGDSPAETLLKLCKKSLNQ